MPIELPTQVLQGLGLAPPPVVQPPPAIPPIDSSLEGAPQPGGSSPPPSTAPPQVTEPGPGAQPPVLPSLAERSPAPTGEPNRDFMVPVGAFGGQPAPQPQQPQRAAGSPAPDAQLQRAQQKQSQADVDSANAIAAQRDVDVIKARDEMAAHNVFDARAAEIEKQRKALVDESTKIRAQKQAYVDATMKDADNYKIDRQKEWNDMGVGHHIGWWIAMAMSGLGEAMQGRGGGNPVVQMLQQKMHDSVVAQIDQRDQLRQKNARAQHELDKYDAFSKDRMAQISLLDAQNDKRLANELRSAGARAAEPQAQARALSEAAKLEKESAEKAQKAAEFASTNDIAKRQLQVSQGQLGVAQFNAREAQRHDMATEELTAQQRDIEALKLEKQGKDNEAKLVRERALGGEVRPVKDASGKVVGSEVGLITKKDDSTWIPNGTETSVTALQKSHNDTLQVLGSIDAIRQMGPEWLSDIANSDKKQKLDQLIENAMLQVVQAQKLGVINGKDATYALGTLGVGTKSVTGFRDVMAGLAQARESFIRNHNVDLRTAGLDKTWEGPSDPLKAGAHEQTPTEQLQTSLKVKPDENPQRAWQTTYAQTLKSSGGDIEAAKRSANEAMISAGTITPAQRVGLDKLKAQAIGGDAEALAAIEDVAKAGGSATIKRLATEALSEIRTAAAPRAPGPDVLRYDNTYDPAGYDPASLSNRFHQPAQPTITPRTRSASVP